MMTKTFTLKSACGRLDAPQQVVALLHTPTKAGDFDANGNCKHKAEYRDEFGNCLRCGAFEGAL